jgi:hypothetical protein
VDITAATTGESLLGVVYFAASDCGNGPDITWANSRLPRVVIPAGTYWRVENPYVVRMEAALVSTRHGPRSRGSERAASVSGTVPFTGEGVPL